ncbi:MAG: hypothetical protein ACO29U_03820 [Crocinitomicaceae bacterium]
MKFGFFILTWCMHLAIHAQLVTSTPENSSKTKNGEHSSLIYMDFQQMTTSPKLSQNTDFLTIPLGERANEQALKSWSYQFGMCTPLSKHLIIDGGLAFIQNGEQYTWTSNSTDSSFAYQTKYRYFGMPIQLKFETGKDVSFFVGAGLSPQLFQSYQQDIQWKDSLGNASKLTLNDEKMCETFVLSALASTGINVHFKSNYGLRLSLYYRYQLTNAYGPYQYFKYFSSGIGGGIALTRRL